MEASTQQRPDAAGGAEAVEHLVRGARPAGQPVGSTPHTPATCARCGRVVDASVAGQLVGLLPVLAAALTVALAGERPVARVRPAGQPEREREVDERLRGVRADAVLLGAAGGEDHRRSRRAEQLRDGLAGPPRARPVIRSTRSGQ